MDAGPKQDLWNILPVIIVLLLGAAYFAVMETAFASASRIRLKAAADHGNRRAEQALYVLDHFDQAITTLLIGTNILHLTIATLVTVAVQRQWGMWAVTAGTLVTTVVVFFAGEMLPKSIAKKYAERLAMRTARSLRFFMVLFKPLSALLTAFGNAVARRVQSEPAVTVTEDELADIIENMTDDGELTAERGELMSSALSFADVPVESVITARVDVAAVDVDDPPEEILAYVREQGAPLVVKADGLAAGKGVIVATELEQAEEAVRECFGGTFGDAGNTVVIEEMLVGPECSLLAFTDGKTVRPMATSQDHKRALEGDKGPNTGGMGVYSPVPIVTDEEHATMVTVMEQTVAELAAEGIDYRGCLYGGFMLTPAGPKVLEFNARFGDPETQVVLPRLKNDLVEVMLACANCELDQIELDWRDEWAVAVVLTSAGYPGSYEKGKVITGIEDAEAMENVTVYHAGTAVVDGQLVTNGGRVLAVTALGDTFENARNLAYEACEKIDFEGKTLRHDIGLRALRGRDAWDA